MTPEAKVAQVQKEHLGHFAAAAAERAHYDSESKNQSRLSFLCE